MVTDPCRSGDVKMLAAATASWTARLMPTPPIGDIACAASPMHNRPGRDHRRNRSTRTVSSLISSQSVSSPTRSRVNGIRAAISSRNDGNHALPDCCERAFRDDKRALPVMPPINHHQDPAAIDATERLPRIVGMLRQPQPQCVHRCTEVDDLQPGPVANDRSASVGAHGQVGANLQYAMRRVRPHALDLPAVGDQLRNFRLHDQME
jgi:hypothetical protein